MPAVTSKYGGLPVTSGNRSPSARLAQIAVARVDALLDAVRAEILAQEAIAHLLRLDAREPRAVGEAREHEQPHRADARPEVERAGDGEVRGLLERIPAGQEVVRRVTVPLLALEDAVRGGEPVDRDRLAELRLEGEPTCLELFGREHDGAPRSRYGFGMRNVLTMSAPLTTYISVERVERERTERRCSRARATDRPRPGRRRFRARARARGSWGWACPRSTSPCRSRRRAPRR